MKKLTTWAITLLLIASLTSCGTATAVINPQLQSWLEFACDTYEEARPVIVALLDAAEANPELVSEKYRDDVKKFREETAPKLDRGLKVLCSARAGEPVEHLLTAERRGVDWNAVALTTARVATVGLQLWAQGKLSVPSSNLGPDTRETLTVKLDRRSVKLFPART